MPIDFPNSPTSGQTYTVGAITWQWDGSTWKALGSSNPGRDYVSATAPSSPAEGARWLNSNDLKTYTYYDSQWIESSPNLKGETGLQGQPAGNNVIINGAFDVWQRGTSFANFADGIFTADRWVGFRDGSGATTSITRESFTVGAAPATGYESQYYMRYAVTAAGSGNTYRVLDNRIEDVRTLAGQTVTISFFAKADSARQISVALIQNFGAGGSGDVGGVTTNFTMSASWQRFSVTVAVPSIVGKTVNAGSFLYLRLVLPAGVAMTTDIWGVQLEAGSVATPFRRNGANLQAELAACQRYYVRYTPSAAYSAFAQGISESTTRIQFNINLPVQMRIAATSLDYSTLVAYDTISLLNVSSLGLNFTSDKICNVSATVASATQYRPYFLFSNNSTSAYVGISAEL